MYASVSPLPPRLSIATQRCEHRLLVTMSGVLDLATRHDLIATVADAITADVDVIQVDAKELEFCDSTGLSALLGLRRAAGAEGRYLYLTNARSTVRTVLEVTGLTQLTEPPPLTQDRSAGPRSG
jgi:anti-sigma B factor antagonist